MRKRTQLLYWYGLAVIIVLLDQYTKELASRSLEYGQPLRIFFWFDLTLHHNEGAAFSFLSDAGGWQRFLFTAIASLISAGIFLWLLIDPPARWLLTLSLTCILGGAVGNLWDRVTLGYVVDFISVHYRNYYFPTFNIADSAITIGAACMLLDAFIDNRRPAGAASEKGQP